MARIVITTTLVEGRPVREYWSTLRNRRWSVDTSEKTSSGFFELSIYGRERQGFGEGGGVDSSAQQEKSSLLRKKEGILLDLSCQVFARLLLADLELVLWSRRVVALWYVHTMRSLSTCLSLLCCGPLLLFSSSSTILAFQVNTAN